LVGRVLAKSRDKSKHSTQQVEQVVHGGKREVEHFVAEESGDPNNDQNKSAQNDVGLGKDSFHQAHP
jgi:hypothetical protein